MKFCTRLLLFFFVLLLFSKTQSQVKIGDNTKTINPNSLLELESSNKGLLIPRLTNDQIKAMTSVPTGMILFSITDSAVYVRKDTGWAILGYKTLSGSSLWTANGNDIYNANGGNVGIGTGSPLARLHVLDSSVLFSADGNAPSPAPNVPLQGAGRRMMWYAGKGAFRAGRVTGTAWDNDSIGRYSIALGDDAKAKGTSSFAAGNLANASGSNSVALGKSNATGQFSIAAGSNNVVASGDNSFAAGSNDSAQGQYSTALGYGTSARANYSTAIGYKAIATGNNSIALGNTDTASSDYAIAIGQYTNASGQTSLAIGRNSHAKGKTSFSAGDGTTASGIAATSLGGGTTASGDQATSIGEGTIASGNTSLATGVQTIASGAASTTLGAHTTASGTYSIAGGHNTAAPSYAEVAFGAYNTSYTGFKSDTWQATDRILTVGNGKSADSTSNAMVILKSGNTGIGTSLPANRLSVSTNDTGYIASFQNINTSTGGDGIKIKLGQAHPMWNGSGYYNVTLPNAQIISSQEQEIKNLITSGGSSFTINDFLNFTPFPLYAGTTIQITNLVVDALNKQVPLPLEQPATTIDTKIPEISVGNYSLDLGVTTVKIPIPVDNGSTYSLTIPGFTLFPKLSDLPNTDFPSFTFPNLPTSFPSNVLSNKNEFLNFSDKDDRKLGSVIAESPSDWLQNYLDPATVTSIVASIGGIDLAKDYLGLLASATQLTENFNQIGVEYTSGHGDYAEWLERENQDEFISAGDIIAVKGGKISKSLQGAEQVMVVSHKPVVLGNTPPEGKEPTGNKVAFMGQVPVKIMGPVNSGDYILAEGDVPGYGIAKNPSKMTAADFKLSVGRAWEQNVNEGPKMVNTLIGVDNGDYLKILQNNQKQISETNKKVDEIEKRLQLLEKSLSQKTKSSLSNFSRN